MSLNNYQWSNCLFEEKIDPLLLISAIPPKPNAPKSIHCIHQIKMILMFLTVPMSIKDRKVAGLPINLVLRLACRFLSWGALLWRLTFVFPLPLEHFSEEDSPILFPNQAPWLPGADWAELWWLLVLWSTESSNWKVRDRLFFVFTKLSPNCSLNLVTQLPD